MKESSLRQLVIVLLLELAMMNQNGTCCESGLAVRLHYDVGNAYQSLAGASDFRNVPHCWYKVKPV